MAKVLQHRRGTATEHSDFVGAEGEFTYDTSEKRVRVHDGLTKGGVPLAKVSEVTQVQTNLNSAKTELQNKIDEVESAAGDAFQEDILEAASRVSTVQADLSQATLAGLQKAVAALEGTVASLQTQLNQKLSTSVRHVVEAWSNGSSWYRKYSDGWIEQGGKSGSYADQSTVTVTLNTNFANTNYTVVATQSAGVEGSYTNGVTSKNYKVNSFQLVYRTGGTAQFYWEAKGY